MIGQSTINLGQKLKVECNDSNNCEDINDNRYGIYARAIEADSPGEDAYGIYGRGDGYVGYGVYGSADGYASYGIYGTATGYSNWAGYFSGDVYATGSFTSSDERFKKNVRPVENIGMLAKTLQLQPLRYQFRTDEELQQQGLPLLNAKDGEHLGLIAQDLEQVFPELVTDVVHVLKNGSSASGSPETVTTKAINYQELTVILLAAIQEQQKRIEALEEALGQK